MYIIFSRRHLIYISIKPNKEGSEREREREREREKERERERERAPALL